MFKTSMLPMNLQYFAEPETEPTGAPATEPDSENEPTDDAKTFSRAELASIAKAQTQKALKDFRESDEFKDLLATAKAAGVEEANMTDKEKREAEKARETAEYQKRIDALDHREAMADTKDQLTDAGLPTVFASFLADKDKTAREQNVKEFSATFNDAVHKAVLAKMKGPETPNNGAPATTPDKKFSEMNLDERTKLYHDNPQLYAQLSQQ
ncbi:hypothetical protein [Lactobacillus farciminis KCTC 3681 = DSM 20184] [Lactiplantibacillus mudanjiangensis]|uniref:DUF4355 domain-containing protein n=1 Tax=Lactiplantibacillus mudanjiangensis TaxID=1296538 RepID=UPI0010142DCE|nr:hypothetical protein [Lactobacillus farciminis KCTC 3681 = DSM 20184] [Lactiplantibacillus mudanjiangensis]